MANDIKFADGLYFNKPHENAPDFVLGRISVKPKEFIDWMRANHKAMNEHGYLNIKVNRSRQGKVYVALDEWKPDPNRQPAQTPAQDPDNFDDDIPF